MASSTVATSRDPGIVDEQVDGAVGGHRLVGPGGDGGAFGDVDRVRRHRHAVGAAPCGGLLEAGLVDVAQRQVTAATGQLEGQRPADPGPGAGDRGHPPVEALHTAVLSDPGPHGSGPGTHASTVRVSLTRL